MVIHYSISFSSVFNSDLKTDSLFNFPSQVHQVGRSSHVMLAKPQSWMARDGLSRSTIIIRANLCSIIFISTESLVSIWITSLLHKVLFTVFEQKCKSSTLLPFNFGKRNWYLWPLDKISHLTFLNSEKVDWSFCLQSACSAPIFQTSAYMFTVMFVWKALPCYEFLDQNIRLIHNLLRCLVRKYIQRWNTENAVGMRSETIPFF